MARVSDVGIDQVPEALRPIYRRFAGAYGPFLNQVRVFAHRPPALEHIMGLLLDLADESLVPKRRLEVALVTVSRLNACAYCVAHHTPRLIEQGLDADTAANILEPDCPGLDGLDRLVRDFAIQVTTRPNRMGDAIFDALRAHFSEAQIVELTLRVALCGFFNRFNDALAIEIEDGALTDMLSKGAREADLPRAAKKATGD